MARAARTPKAPPPAEGAPAEPDLLADVPPPREARHLFGHGEATARLADAFSGEAPPQALLLEGPRGIGKATLAFRLARALMTAPRALSPDLASDPQSRAGSQIAAGTHPGLLHVTRPWDEKAKRFKADLTVDAVRAITPLLGATSATGGWRIVIVDAVDDMNPSAANAVLKNLEEPPAASLFVLIAHVAGRVLPTIRSRCRAVRLRPLAEAEVAAALEALGADTSVAAAGEGSVRRALALADAGREVVERTRRLLSPRALSDTTAHHALAESAASRREGESAAVIELIFDAIAARARADNTPAPIARLYADLWLEAAAERRRVEIFNLDQREYVLSLLSRLAHADRASRS